jgi:hypothetical protein
MKYSTTILLLALVVAAWSATAQDQGGAPPTGERPPRGEGGRGGPGALGARRGFHLLPPPVQEQLKLTADQQKQLAALEAELKAKLEKILTPEQLKQLQQMRPPPPAGGMGGAVPGGRGSGGEGGLGSRGSQSREDPGKAAPQRPPSE